MNRLPQVAAALRRASASGSPVDATQPRRRVGAVRPRHDPGAELAGLRRGADARGAAAGDRRRPARAGPAGAGPADRRRWPARCWRGAWWCRSAPCRPARERIGSGELGHRLSIKTGDELEALANQFNRSAAALEESYATLEQRVEDRTRELTRIARAADRDGRDPAGHLPVADRRAAGAGRRRRGGPPLLRRHGRRHHPARRQRVRAHRARRIAHGGGRRAAAARPQHFARTRHRRWPHGPSARHERPGPGGMGRRRWRSSGTHGFKAAIAAPMLREGVAIGGILLRKTEVGPFTPRQIELLETFAAQAVIAIENVRLFTEIQEKSRQLEIASQHKSQFLANMSHELRTPLNAIIGYTEMMADGLYGDVPEKAQGVLERVQSNGRHLLGLINDVLDLSKIEAGQLVLTIEEYSVADMVATVLSATESLARAKNLELGSDVRARPADRHRRCAAADAGAAQPGRQCHQVHRPGLRSRSAAAAGRRPLRAVGRRYRLRHRAGRPGARSSRSSSRSTTPARARRAARASASRSRAASSSCMAAASPSSPRSARARPSRSSIPINASAGQGSRPMSKKILVVEDTEDNRQILRDLLGMAGYDMIEAHDGAEGVAKATEHKPDLILMDIQMPVMDGYEATRRIKADPALKAIPVDRRDLLRAVGRRGEGARRRLRRLHRQALQPASDAGQGPRDHRLGGAAMRDPARILVVDDVADNVEILRMRLEQPGLRGGRGRGWRAGAGQGARRRCPTWCCSTS